MRRVGLVGYYLGDDDGDLGSYIMMFGGVEYFNVIPGSAYVLQVVYSIFVLLYCLFLPRFTKWQQCFMLPLVLQPFC